MPYSCLCSPSEDKCVMLLNGEPVALKYKMDRVWRAISKVQKEMFYKSHAVEPYWWKPMRIDPMHGEKIYA